MKAENGCPNKIGLLIGHALISMTFTFSAGASMLKNLHMQNFKGFQEIKSLEFRPITILCGTNSCGKSSILQSILLMKQTLESLDPSQTLLLNGRFVHLGTFDNVIYKHDLKRDLVFEMSFDVPPNFLSSKRSGQIFPLSLMLRDLLVNEPGATFDPQHTRYKIDFKVTFRSVEQGQQTLEHVKPISIQQLEFTAKGDTPGQGSTKTSRVKVGRQPNGLYSVELDNVSPQYSGEKTGTSRFSARMEFANLSPSKIEAPNPNEAKGQESRVRLQYVFQTIVWLLRNFFARYTYLGPLREAPARRYIYEDAIVEIGLKGENAPYLHLAEQWNTVSGHYFYDAQTDSFAKSDDISLTSAVKRWLELMSIQGFNPSRQNELVYVELDSNSAPDTRVNISDVGFGVSQIFPIILEGLRMEHSGTLILEQPEIHLHPNVQMQMADYFVALALSGKQVIVETHSDHIINRVVRRIVQDKDDSLAKMVAIYFVRPNMNGSVIEPVQIDPAKGIINWPAEFFDQTASEQERIIRAGLEKRAARREEVS